MKNQPIKIYLNIGSNGECKDFDELDSSEVTWSTNSIYDDSLEYIQVKDYDALKQSAELSISQLNGEKAGLQIEYDNLKLGYGLLAAERDKLRDFFDDVLSNTAFMPLEKTDILRAGLTDKEVGG